MTLYLKVTRDKYELPVAVADTQADLARVCGVRDATICKCIKNARKDKIKSQYIVVEVDDAEQI